MLDLTTNYTATDLLDAMGAILATEQPSWVATFDAVSRNAKHGDLPYMLDCAVYGIAWAMQTGRLSGAVMQRLDALDTAAKYALVADVAVACPTSGDVPRYLIGRFAV